MKQWVPKVFIYVVYGFIISETTIFHCYSYLCSCYFCFIFFINIFRLSICKKCFSWNYSGYWFFLSFPNHCFRPRSIMVGQIIFWLNITNEDYIITLFMVKTGSGNTYFPYNFSFIQQYKASFSGLGNIFHFLYFIKKNTSHYKIWKPV